MRDVSDVLVRAPRAPPRWPTGRARAFDGPAGGRAGTSAPARRIGAGSVRRKQPLAARRPCPPPRARNPRVTRGLASRRPRPSTTAASPLSASFSSAQEVAQPPRAFRSRCRSARQRAAMSPLIAVPPYGRQPPAGPGQQPTELFAHLDRELARGDHDRSRGRGRERGGARAGRGANPARRCRRRSTVALPPPPATQRAALWPAPSPKARFLPDRFVTTPHVASTLRLAPGSLADGHHGLVTALGRAQGARLRNAQRGIVEAAVSYMVNRRS